ncbi:Protein phosphatase 2C 16 [Forsythia ovata]|uniref:Protein phosphatase 2C 16 n=1 Tax=Forsythia ovata TaxID=205694 RepID=A0ABD1RML9_9LAMI
MEKTFTKCFLRVDDEIGGKASLEPVAPETVGSTIVVAIVCSSHIVVSNCSDSKVVIFRDECLILASDGLWDVMKNEEVCDNARKKILICHKNYDATLLLERAEGIDPAAQDATEYLSNLTIQKDSKDNISVVVVDLKSQRKIKRGT